MKTNIQITENLALWGRISRLTLGIAMLAPIFFATTYSPLFLILSLLAIFPIVSAVYGYCPLLTWIRSVRRNKDFTLDTTRRLELGLVAALLIGGGLASDTSNGFLTLLPLLAIYPAFLALYGEKLISAVLASFSRDTLSLPNRREKAKVLLVVHDKKPHRIPGSIEHAA